MVSAELIYQNLIMGYKFAAYHENNPFTDEQRKTLCSIVDEFDFKPFHSKNPVKLMFALGKAPIVIKKVCERFELKYNEWGGDIELIKKACSDAEKLSNPYVSEGIEKLKKFKIPGVVYEQH